MPYNESPPTLPPGELTAAQLMKEVFPLVVQAAAQSASAATAAAEQGRSMEGTLSLFKSELKASVDACSSAIDRLAVAKETENTLLEEKNRLLGKENQTSEIQTVQWHQTLRETLVSPVAMQIIQLIVVLATAAGVVRSLPTNEQPPATVSEAAEQESPGEGGGER